MLLCVIVACCSCSLLLCGKVCRFGLLLFVVVVVSCLLLFVVCCCLLFVVVCSLLFVGVCLLLSVVVSDVCSWLMLFVVV